MHSVRAPSRSRSTTARSERPISRWISTLRPSWRPLELSRAFRSSVEYGSIEYSAVSQPPATFWYFIQAGTDSSIIALQMTRVSPLATSTEPVECGAILGVKERGRSWSARATVVAGHGAEGRPASANGKAESGAPSPGLPSRSSRPRRCSLIVSEGPTASQFLCHGDGGGDEMDGAGEAGTNERANAVASECSSHHENQHPLHPRAGLRLHRAAPAGLRQGQAGRRRYSCRRPPPTPAMRCSNNM